MKSRGTPPIVCATDFSPSAAEAATIAAGIARRMQTSLLLAHVVELPVLGHVRGEPLIVPLPGWYSGRHRAEEEHAERQLELEAERLRALDVRVDTELTVGEAAWVLRDLADVEQTPLVVIGSKRRGLLGRMVLGSVGERLLQTSPAPFVVVTGRTDGLLAWAQHRGTLDVLAAVDADEALVHVAALARLFHQAHGCRFHYAHVSALPQAVLHSGSGGALSTSFTDADVEAAIHTLARRVDLPPSKDRVHVLQGRPPVELARFASRFAPDLVIVGTRQNRGLLTPSVATSLLRETDAPIAIAPAPA